MSQSHHYPLHISHWFTLLSYSKWLYFVLPNYFTYVIFLLIYADLFIDFFMRSSQQQKKDLLLEI